MLVHKVANVCCVWWNDLYVKKVVHPANGCISFMLKTQNIKRSAG